MNTAEVRAKLAEYEDELLIADGFDDAIIGLAEHWGQDGRQTAVCYDYGKCVAILVGKGLSEDDAHEWLSVNTLGAYVGAATPVFVTVWRTV